MAKKDKRARSASALSDQLRSGYAPQVVVIVVIPSHTKYNDRSSDQATVARKGMELLAKLFGGATQFNAQVGVWESKKDGSLLWDNPILIESYVDRDLILDEKLMGRLVGFVKQMGRDLEQEAAALVIDGTMHFFRDYTDAPQRKLV